MNNGNCLSSNCLWNQRKDFLIDPIIDQPLPFFDTITPAGPPTFFKYPRIIIIEQPQDYLKFNTIQKNRKNLPDAKLKMTIVYF